MTDLESRDELKLGTFGGVFAPSVLTILGLVLFLRLGFVTGNVGLVQMLLIMALATTVSVLTTISLSAIATNLRVGGGGVYFLISRTLGPAFGGAIGLVLYLAMSVSVSFYTIGMGEAVTSAIGSDSTALPRIIAAVVIVGLLGLAWAGADIATRLQYVVMVFLVLAIVAYFIGVLPDMSASQLSDNLGKPVGGGAFWVGFAIFFPAITGFTQGVAMSGDLRTPSRSITVGTFGAIGVSTIIYLLVIITFAAAVPLGELRADTAIMRRLSASSLLIDVGVIAATLSSAIASMLGAPRTLQRLAEDRLIRPLKPFAVGVGPASNPRRGAVLTTVIALLTVAAGDLDVVAPIISMFFLASYGLINYATYAETRAASTSFRPTFRFFDRRLSLLGTVACVGAIIAIDPLAGGLAGTAIFGLYTYLQRSVQQVRWVDSSRGRHASEVRSHLRLMSDFDDAGRDWRPFTVAFAPRDQRRRKRLTEVGSWLEGGAGFTTVTRIITGRGAIARKHAERVNLELQNELAGNSFHAYGRVLVANDLESGVSAMLQAHGLGAIRPNLAMFSWYGADDPDRSNAGDYETMVQTGARYGCHVCVVSAPDDGWRRVKELKHNKGTIFVWWSDDRSGQLLTLLAWICTRTEVWDNATIDVWVASTDAGDHDRVAKLLQDARIPVKVRGKASPEAFTQLASDADLVFAPLRVRRGSPLGPGDVAVDDLVDLLPVVIFAQAATDVELDVQPDESEAATLAVAVDRADELTARADELDHEAGSLMVSAEMNRIDAMASGRDPDRTIVDRAKHAHRAYIDARTRADEAWRLVNELDPSAANGHLDPDLWMGSDPD